MAEQVDHLILHCSAAYNLLFKIFGIHRAMPSTVAALLFGWRNWFGKQSSAI